MKLLKWMIGLVVVLLVAFAVARNVLIRDVVRKAVRQATGFDLEVGSVHLGLLSPTFDMDEVTLVNPDDFPEAAAFHIRQVHVRYELASLFSDTIRLKEVVLDIPSAVVVVKDDGESNLERLSKAAKNTSEDSVGTSDSPAGSADSGSVEPPADQGKASKRLHIGQLKLKLGTVHTKRYKLGEDKPETNSYDLHIDQTYDDVNSIQQIVTLVTTEILVRELPNLLGGLEKALNGNSDDLKDTGEQLKKTFEGLFR